MKLSKLDRRIILGSMAVAVTFTVVPSSSDAVQPALKNLAVAAPTFLTPRPGAARIAAFVVGLGSADLLPTSVLPNTSSICSVENADPGPTPECSVDSGGQPCSAHNDSGQQCSAFSTPGPSPLAQCSTFGLQKTKCSILHPPQPGTGRPTFCSAIVNVQGGQVACSVLAPGKKQSCSAENPAHAPDPNVCSAIDNVGGFRPICSVLNGGNQLANYCSVGFLPNPFPKNCSAIGPAPGPLCSIALGLKGACTAFKKAGPVGACSAGSPPAFCSVIGGNPGLKCRQP